MSGRIRVVQAGPMSTVQDCGRVGYQRFGVSVSGAMDHDALLLGNRVVGNDECASGIEVTLGGASFEFLEDALVAITGADLGATLDGLKAPRWVAMPVAAGSVLAFTGPVLGLRAYVCVSGGVATEPQLRSRSTHAATGLGGINGRQIAQGDELATGEATGTVTPWQAVPTGLRPGYGVSEIEVRVIPGPQVDAFSEAGLQTFYSSEFIVTDRSDRQGIRFDGPVIASLNGRYDIVSDAVPVGSIQVPGDGRPIVLMADRQTTGGYAKIGVVATVDLPLLAQAAPGTTVRFREVSIEEGQALHRNRRRSLLETLMLPPLSVPELRVFVGGAEYSVLLGQIPQAAGAAFLSLLVNDQALGVHAEFLEESSG